MSKFTTPLTLTMLPNCMFEVAVEFEYHVGVADSENVITVKKGFKTDLASVPRFFWFILPPHGYYGKAAVIHDCLYRNCYRTRKECDDIFKEAMQVLNVKPWKIWVMYTAVRMWGKSSYRMSP